MDELDQLKLRYYELKAEHEELVLRDEQERKHPSQPAAVGTKPLTWEQIARMTPQEYEARRADIRSFLQKNAPERGGRWQ